MTAEPVGHPDERRREQPLRPYDGTAILAIPDCSRILIQACDISMNGNCVSVPIVQLPDKASQSDRSISLAIGLNEMECCRPRMLEALERAGLSPSESGM